MSTTASLIAVGPFRRDFAEREYYEYPPEWYAQATRGQPIMTEFFHVPSSGTASALARILGVAFNDPSSWKVSLQPSDHLRVMAELRRGVLGPAGVEERDLDALIEFLENGYDVWFRLDT